MLYLVILYWHYIKAKYIYGTHSQYLHCFLWKNQNGFFSPFNNAKHYRCKFPVKLICCIAFGSTLALLLYLNLLISFFNNFWNKHNLAYNWLCNHPNFSNVYHMLLYYFWLVDQKKNFPSILTLQSFIPSVVRKNVCNLLGAHNLQISQVKPSVLLKN